MFSDTSMNVLIHSSAEPVEKWIDMLFRVVCLTDSMLNCEIFFSNFFWNYTFNWLQLDSNPQPLHLVHKQMNTWPFSQTGQFG